MSFLLVDQILICKEVQIRGKILWKKQQTFNEKKKVPALTLLPISNNKDRPTYTCRNVLQNSSAVLCCTMKKGVPCTVKKLWEQSNVDFHYQIPSDNLIYRHSSKI